MADVTVARAQREEMLTLPTEVPAETSPSPVVPALPRSLMILWAGLGPGDPGFLVIGRLRIGAGNLDGQATAGAEIWSRFLGFLTDHGAVPGRWSCVVTAAAD